MRRQVENETARVTTSWGAEITKSEACDDTGKQEERDSYG